MEESILKMIGLDEKTLKGFIESANQQGPYCGILSRRSLSHLNPIHDPQRKYEFLYTGSMVDGTGHAAGGMWQIDADLMVEHLELKDEGTIRNTDKPGYVWIEAEDAWNFTHIHRNRRSYISANGFRGVSKEQFDITEPSGNHYEISPTSKTGAAREVRMKANVSKLPEFSVKTSRPRFQEPEKDFTYHYDYVASIHCTFWPEKAKGWITRAQKIYTCEEVEQLISYGFHFVPKSATIGGDADLDFRYSFSITEDQIVKGWADIPWLCYLILKSLLKIRLTEIKKVITSYCFKTLMMWACEEKDKSFWKEENIISCVIGIFDDLLLAMVEKKLCHYFIPEINLFDDLPDASMQQAMLIIEKIRSEIENASKKMPGQHWICTVFKSSCHHPHDQISFAQGEQLAFSSLKFSNQSITQQIKEAAVATVMFRKENKITQKEFEKKEILMNVCLRMMEDIMAFPKQVETMTNYEMSLPAPTGTTSSLDPYLADQTNESDGRNYFQEMAKPQLAIEKIINKYFLTTDNAPDDPRYLISQVIPESDGSFTNKKWQSHTWKSLESLPELNDIFPFPQSLESLNEEDKKAWNYMCEAAKVSRQITGVDKPRDPKNHSAAVLMEHVFWGSLGTEKGDVLRNINVGGADIQALFIPLNEIIQSKQESPSSQSSAARVKREIQEEPLD